jgi:transcriptional regulator with XRE-family HTH domain
VLNYRNTWHGLGEIGALCFSTPMSINLDELSRKNLLRILRERGLKQVELAAKIGTTPQHVNSILRGERGIGPDIMARICRELKIEPWEFFIDDKTPIVRNDKEKERLFLYREEERLGVAEEVIRYETFKIADAKKTSGAGKKSAHKGIRRNSSS